MLNVIVISIIILNIISISILLKMLKGTDATFKIAITIGMILVNLILANIICSIGQAGISEEISSATKPMMMFIILPINLILISCPLSVQINKWKSVEINKEQLIKRIIIFLLIDIVIVILECIYVKNIQTSIVEMKARK